MAYIDAMSLKALLPLAALVLVAATPGRLGTLPSGHYECGEPGDALRAAWIAEPEENFTIISGSSYETEHGRGTYLMLGDRVTFTSGPKRGQEFELRNSSTLAKLRRDDKPDPLRCIRRTDSR